MRMCRYDIEYKQVTVSKFGHFRSLNDAAVPSAE